MDVGVAEIKLAEDEFAVMLVCVSSGETLEERVLSSEIGGAWKTSSVGELHDTSPFESSPQHVHNLDVELYTMSGGPGGLHDF